MGIQATAYQFSAFIRSSSWIKAALCSSRVQSVNFLAIMQNMQIMVFLLSMQDIAILFCLCRILQFLLFKQDIAIAPQSI